MEFQNERTAKFLVAAVKHLGGRWPASALNTGGTDPIYFKAGEWHIHLLGNKITDRTPARV